MFKKCSIAVFILLVSGMIYSADNKGDNPLFPILQKGKWGYMDSTGKVIIKPKYESALDFQEGYAQVKVDNNWGYIDTKGKITIKPIYSTAYPFSENKALVKIKEQWNYIDSKGKIVLTPQVDEAKSFYEGLACVMVESKWGFIDTNGKFVIQPQYHLAGSFSEGLAPVWIGDNCGYIDTTGTMIISPRFSYGEGFSEGLACVRMGTYENVSWGYIDKTGAFKINTRPYNTAKKFTEGLAAVNTGGSWNKWALRVGGKYGFIDTTGNTVINPQYDNVEPFRNGLAKVCIEDKWGYIDKSGKYIWNLQN